MCDYPYMLLAEFFVTQRNAEESAEDRGGEIGV